MSAPTTAPVTAAETSPLDCTPDTDIPDADIPHVAGPRFRIERGFLAITALLAFLGWVLHGADVSAGAWAHGTASYVAIFTTALLGLIAVHEGAHALVGRLYGHRILSVRIGSKFGVTMLGDHTPTSMAITAAAGPVIGTLASVVVLAAVSGSPFSPLWAAAGVALVENVANVALFFMAGSDGSKIVAALRRPRAAAPNANATEATRSATPVALAA